MRTTTPAEAFPAGEYLADELEARGWSQADFAEIIGRPVQFVSEIVNGKKEITAESAAQIAAALGSAPETWLALQARYRLWQLDQDPARKGETDRVVARAAIAAVIPLPLLEKRGVVDAKADPVAILRQVMADFNMDTSKDAPVFRLAAKRTNDGDALTLTQRGWLWSAQVLARRQQVADYEAAAFRQLVEGLRHRVHEPADLSGLPAEFGAAGVHLVHVEHMAGGKIDGAAFMLGEHPVVALSGRGKRFDKLFFALLHEAAHVLEGHVADGVTLDDQAMHPGGKDAQRKEDVANRQAEKWALGGPVKPNVAISGQWVAERARELGVPASFVIGNLQHHGLLDWRSTLARRLPTADAVLKAW